MEKRILGRTGLEVSVLGLGGLFLSKLGGNDQDEARRATHRALELGVNYVDTAPGSALPPVVLLHGITLRHDVWAPQFHQLADRYRVIAVDLRGHGRSTAGSAGRSLSMVARAMARHPFSAVQPSKQ